MFYNGALDVICSLSAEEAVLDNMDWDLRDSYEKAPKKIWRVQSADQEVAGYVHHVRNLYQVRIGSFVFACALCLRLCLCLWMKCAPAVV